MNTDKSKRKEEREKERIDQMETYCCTGQVS